MELSQIIGWLGSIVYILAYLLLSVNKLKADQPLYHFLNLVGAVALISHGIHLSDLPNVVVNLVWALIALFAIITLFTKSRVKP